jgi:hypothetical protein
MSNLVPVANPFVLVVAVHASDYTAVMCHDKLIILLFLREVHHPWFNTIAPHVVDRRIGQMVPVGSTDCVTPFTVMCPQPNLS